MSDKFSYEHRDKYEILRLLKKHQITPTQMSVILGVCRTGFWKCIAGKQDINKFEWLVMLLYCKELKIKEFLQIKEF